MNFMFTLRVVMNTIMYLMSQLTHFAIQCCQIIMQSVLNDTIRQNFPTKVLSYIAKIRYIKHDIGKLYVGNAIYHLTTSFNTLIMSSFSFCPYLKQIMDRNGTNKTFIECPPICFYTSEIYRIQSKMKPKLNLD